MALYSPLRWVPSLYFAMGLPFVVLNMVSAVLFKDLGISDAQIAFWTSQVMWPWTIKFLWSPFLELYRTKKFWVVATQLLSGVLFGLAALSLHLPSFFAVTVAVFAVVAFSGATHDIAADVNTRYTEAWEVLLLWKMVARTDVSRQMRRS